MFYFMARVITESVKITKELKKFLIGKKKYKMETLDEVIRRLTKFKKK